MDATCKKYDKIFLAFFKQLNPRKLGEGGGARGEDLYNVDS